MPQMARSMFPLWLIAALCSVCLAASGQLVLKLGVKSLALPQDALAHPIELLAALLSPMIIGGIALFACSVVFWLAAISGQELSRVYPLASLGYVIVTLASIKIFHEDITIYKILGIICIVVGVSILQVRTGSVIKTMISSSSANESRR